jgi:hypothetical protein
MRRLAAALLPAAGILLAAGGPGCAGARRSSSPAAEAPPRGLGEGEARAVVGRFAAAVEAGRWPEAYRLLSARWRQVTTPGRLALDYAGAGPLAREAAGRAAAAATAGAPVRVDGPRAELPVGTGRAAILVVEDGGWRVDALE